MSLVRFAARIAVVRAIRGKTLCGDEIKDSHNPPPDFLKEDAAPFAAVYTDKQATNLKVLDVSRPRDSLTITIEVLVAAKKVGIKANGWEIATTDHGIELAIDVIERQIMAALADEADPWAGLFRALIRDNPSITSERGAEAEGGLRRAGRQIVIEATPLPEPPFGRAPTGVWAAFLALCAEDAVLAPRIDMLQALFGGAPDVDDILSTQRQQLFAAGEGGALLAEVISDGALPPFSEATPT